MNLIKDNFIYQYNRWYKIASIALLVNFLAYLSFLIFPTMSVDDYDAVFQYYNFIDSGRPIMNIIHNNLFNMCQMSAITPLTCIIITTLSGIMLCHLWDIKTSRSKLLLICLWGTHPYFLEAFGFRFAAIAFATCYMLAIISLLLATKSFKIFVYAIIFQTLALLTYQACLGFTLAVALVLIIRSIIINNDHKFAKLVFIRTLLLLIISAISYLIIAKLSVYFFGINRQERFESWLVLDVSKLLYKICWLTIMLFVRLSPVPEYTIAFIPKIILFTLSVTGMCFCLTRKHNLKTKILVFILILAAPYFATFHIIPVNCQNLGWRLCIGLIIISLGFISCAFEITNNKIKNIITVSSILLILSFIIKINILTYEQYHINQLDQHQVTQILSRLYENEKFEPGMKLTIIGNTQGEVFKNTDSSLSTALKYIDYQTKSKQNLSNSAFETDWSKYGIFQHNNAQVTFYDNINKEILELCKNRKPWPARDSCFIHKDTAIVILSTQQ